MNEKDIKNLEAVFAVARREAAHDESMLITIINLKAKLLKVIQEHKELKPETKEQDNG